MVTAPEKDREQELLDRLLDARDCVDYESPETVRKKYDTLFKAYEKDLQKFYIAERNPQERAKLKGLIKEFIACKLQAKAKMLLDQPVEIIQEKMKDTVEYPLIKAQELFESQKKPSSNLLPPYLSIEAHIKNMCNYKDQLTAIVNKAAHPPQEQAAPPPARDAWRKVAAAASVFVMAGTSLFHGLLGRTPS